MRGRLEMNLYRDGAGRRNRGQTQSSGEHAYLGGYLGKINGTVVAENLIVDSNEPRWEFQSSYISAV